MEHKCRYNKIILTGILIASLYWLVETVLHFLVLHEPSLFASFISFDNLDEFLMRSLLALMIVALSFSLRSVLLLRKKEEELIMAKNEWEATVDSFSDPLLIHDSEGRIVRCNKAYQVLAGLPFKQIIGKPYFEVFPKMEGRFKTCIKITKGEIIEQQKEEQEEITVPEINRTFKIRFFKLHVKGKRGEDIFYFTHVMEDITEAKKAREELMASVERYRGLVETSTDAIISMNQDRVITQWNQAASRVLGYSQEEVVGSLIDIIVPGKYKDKHIEGVKRFLNTGSGKVIGTMVELEAMRKDGIMIPVELSLSALKTGSSYLFTGIVRDITKRKLAERELKQEMEITSNMLMIVRATARFIHTEEILRQSVHCATKILGCDICLSYIWDDEMRRFRPSESLGLQTEQVPFFKSNSMNEQLPFVKEAVESNTILFANMLPIGDTDPYELKLFYKWLENMGTCAIIPVMAKTGRLGILSCIYLSSNTKSSGGFSERDITVMNGIANQVATAMEQARLYKEMADKTIELSRKIGVIQAMHDIDRNILSTFDSNTILEMSVNLISKVISCERATVAIVDKENNGFIYRAGFGSSIPKGTLIPFENTNALNVIRTGRPQYTANLNEIKEQLPQIERTFLESGYLSHVRVPLTVKGEIIGVLAVGAKRVAAFSREDLATLEKLSTHIGIALENSRLISDLEDLFLGTVRALSKSIDAKSPWTLGHSERVTKIALRIGKELGLDEKSLRNLELTCLLHDIGKLGGFAELLDKPEKLTSEELSIIRQHPLKGAEIIEPIKQLKAIIPGIKYHHEFYDGNGYPEGLKGEGIPLMARVLCVADTMDIMGADRPYRKGKPMEAIINEIKKCSGTQFDPKVVDAFLKVV